MSATRGAAGPTVIAAGARTPIGRVVGGLGSLTATELGGIAIKGALEKSDVRPEQVDYLIMGQVLQAGAGQTPREPPVSRLASRATSRRSPSTRSVSPASTPSRPPIR